jgi:hypothetical protein
MAYDLLHGHTPGDWTLPSSACGELPKGATGYAPEHWWTAKQAEDKVQEFMKSGGLFGTKLPREIAERRTLEFLRKNSIGIMSGAVGSWLLSAKEQQKIFNKVDDVRYDLRLVGRRVGIAMGCLAGALGVLGIASIYKTSTGSATIGDKAKGYGQISRY